MVWIAGLPQAETVRIWSHCPKPLNAWNNEFILHARNFLHDHEYIIDTNALDTSAGTTLFSCMRIHLQVLHFLLHDW